MKLFLIALILFMFFIRLQAQEKTYTADETSISASMGETFYIKVESNKTTGYSWSVGEISDGAQVVVLGSDYTSESSIPGHGGEESWHFKALSSGNVKLIFSYIRPWEKTGTAAKTLTFNIEVK